MYPHSTVQKTLCTDVALLSSIALAVALFGFYLPEPTRRSCSSPRLSVSLSLNADFSLSAIDFCFLSSQPPPTRKLQWLLNQARAWPQTASPWAYRENQSWDCLKCGG